MYEIDGKEFLLWSSILLGISLIFISQAAVGRGLGDLHRLSMREAADRSRTQSWVNIRPQINYVLFGIVFTIINVAILTGAPEIWRMWTFRILWNLLLIGFNISAILDWRAERKLVRLSIERQKAEKEALEAQVEKLTPPQEKDTPDGK